MSARRRDVRLSDDAGHDYDDILLYGIKTWGESRALQYRDHIDEALKRLAAFPLSGRSREDVGANLRSMLIDQHIIYYEILNSEAYVIRILHSRQDPVDAIDSNT